MNISELVKAANRNLWRNKLRTFLTVSAVFIGAFTLTLTNGFGDGLRDFVEKEIKGVDTGSMLSVRAKAQEKELSDEERKRDAVEYKEKDAGVEETRGGNLRYTEKAFREKVADVENIGEISTSMFISGEYLTIENAKKYRFMPTAKQSGATYQLFAGRDIAERGEILVPFQIAKAFDEDASKVIGKNATLVFQKRKSKESKETEEKRVEAKIVGVMPEGVISNFSTVIDTETAQGIYQWQTPQDAEQGFYSFFVRPKNEDEESVAKLKKDLEAKGFVGQTMADQRKEVFAVIDMFKLGLNSFALIALLAASFGIVNTLIIAVLERTKEIGLSKALGMSRGKVFLMFTTESVMLGFWGAILGIVAAFIVGKIASYILLQKYSKVFESYQPLSFSPLSVIGILLLISFIAFLAGVLPAWKASKLNPIEALRYE